MKRLLYVFLLGVLASCAKNDEFDVPAIEILTPAANSSYSYGDTVYVSCLVTSSTGIETVKTGLVNLELTPVLDQKTMSAGVNEIEVTHAIALNDPYLASGEYRIQVVARYHGRLKHQYRNINFSGLEQVTEKIVVLEYAGPMQTKFYLHSPSFVEDSSFIKSQSYSFSGSLPASSAFILIKSEPSVIYAYDDATFEDLWSLDIGLPYPFVSHMHTDRLLYASTGNGEIVGYDGHGEVQFLTTRWDGFAAGVFAMNEEYLASELVSLNGIQRFISVYYMATGAEKNRRLVLYDVLSLAPAGNEFLVISKTSTGYGMNVLDPVEMIITAKNVVIDGTFKDVKNLDEDLFLFLDNHGLKEYDLYLNRINHIMDIDADKIIIDEVTGNILLMSSNEIQLFDYPGYELIFSKSFEREILDVVYVNNK